MHYKLADLRSKVLSMNRSMVSKGLIFYLPPSVFNMILFALSLSKHSVLKGVL